MKTNTKSKSISNVLALLGAAAVGLVCTSDARAECVNPFIVQGVSVTEDGWVMVKVPSNGFNDAGVLTVVPSAPDAFKARVISVATAAFLSGQKVSICRRHEPSVIDPWGKYDRLSWIGIYNF